YFGDGSSLGLKITHSIEPYPLGTAGAVAMLRHVLTDRFLVLYGDTMLDMDLDRLAKVDRTRAAMATLVAHPNDHPYDGDLIEVDENDRIVAWHAKPHAKCAMLGNLVNAGVYVLSPDIFRHIAFGKANDFGRDIFPALVRSGQRLTAYRTAEYIKDMGTPERWRATDDACRNHRIARLNGSNRRKAVFFDLDAILLHPLEKQGDGQHLEICEHAADVLRKINRSEHLAIVVGAGLGSQARTLRIALETQLGHDCAWIDEFVAVPSLSNIDAALQRTIGDLNIDVARSRLITMNPTSLALARRLGCGATLATDVSDAVDEILHGDASFQHQEAA
ncbi:MAG TPA: sugar phosphate nucleotidyltransferase, partial [Pirellulales bacterium]|nr:sugar phosphate nucleotidyltransferase [Pirellulales bacterium]